MDTGPGKFLGSNGSNEVPDWEGLDVGTMLGEHIDGHGIELAICDKKIVSVIFVNIS